MRVRFRKFPQGGDEVFCKLTIAGLLKQGEEQGVGGSVQLNPSLIQPWSPWLDGSLNSNSGPTLIVPQVSHRCNGVWSLPRPRANLGKA